MNYANLANLVAIDSPTGYTQQATQYVHKLLKQYGLRPTYTNKGAVRCGLGDKPTLCLAAHVDTLGAMVSEINGDGTLRITPLGGLSLNGFEGGYCRIITLEGKIYTGTFLLDDPAVHNNRTVSTANRTLANTHIRVDEVVYNQKDIEKLGIRVGDVICFDTNYQELESGFIKSRFMDNKAGCFVLFEVARQLQQQGISVPVELFFSTYEEVGHGSAPGFYSTIEEVVVIDMGVIGNGRTGKETACSICAKDASGPYDYEMRKRLVELAVDNKIPHAIDIYPYYSSDGSAALRAGHDYRVALIGPGVSASHGTERTHKQGIEATINLCLTYIKDRFGLV